jgi:hypothetical protein
LVVALAMKLAKQWQKWGLSNNQLKCGSNCDKMVIVMVMAAAHTETVVAVSGRNRGQRW